MRRWKSKGFCHEATKTRSTGRLHEGLFVPSCLRGSTNVVTDLDFESSQLQLLTDALRAGPGTPEWRAAMETVAPVGAGGGGGADEYKLLYAARERLASGRQYREVRAGPGFTRRVFDAIEDEEAEGVTP